MNDPHMIILKNYVEKLRKTNPQSYTPNFDPNDGGINAKILFLFEKPGRKTDPSYGGSGYISLDNKDETARATKKFLKEANINRKKIVIWNTIPSWNGTRDISIEERKQASLQLSSLLNVLKNLEFIRLSNITITPFQFFDTTSVVDINQIKKNRFSILETIIWDKLIVIFI